MSVSVTSWVTDATWQRALLSQQSVGSQTSAVIIYSLSNCLDENLPTSRCSVKQALVSRLRARSSNRKQRHLFTAKAMEFQI